MDLSSLKCRDKVDTGSGVPLIVNRLSYGHADVEDVLSGSATPIEATLTSDGRSYFGGWHDADIDGPFSDGGVYVERWSAAGRDFHGWIDPTSRKLVQTG